MAEKELKSAVIRPRKKIPMFLIVIFIGTCIGVLFSMIEDRPQPQDAGTKVDPAISREPSNLWYANGKDPIACPSRDILDQAVKYNVERDMHAFNTLIWKGLCTYLNTGEQLFLEDTKILSGLAQVRRPGETTIYWTFLESITRNAPEVRTPGDVGEKSATPDLNDPNSRTEAISSITRMLMAEEFQKATIHNANPTRTSVAGKDNTVLILSSAHYDKILAEVLPRTPEWINSFEQAGFKQIIFQDGKGNSWKVNLDPLASDHEKPTAPTVSPESRVPMQAATNSTEMPKAKLQHHKRSSTKTNVITVQDTSNIQRPTTAEVLRMLKNSK